MFQLFSKNFDQNLSPERLLQLKQHAQKYNIPIKNFLLWDLALTHISYMDSSNQGSYERLEFLGDAVLNLSISSILFEEFPNLSEGSMSVLKSNVADGKTLAKIGAEFDFLSIMKLGRGEKLLDERAQEKVLCDLVESTLAVVFLDCGFPKVKSFVSRIFREIITRSLEDGVCDPKTKLQKIVIKVFKVYPNYEIVDIEGPDHGKIFTVECKINEFSALGKGRSKKEAEQDSAKKVLVRIKDYCQANPDSQLAQTFYAY
ncbi:MAG: ribonuclease III [Brevinemataceae bacterium]